MVRGFELGSVLEGTISKVGKSGAPFRGAFFHFLFFIIKLNLKSELTSRDEISPDFIKIVLF